MTDAEKGPAEDKRHRPDTVAYNHGKTAALTDQIVRYGWVGVRIRTRIVNYEHGPRGYIGHNEGSIESSKGGKNLMSSCFANQ